MYIHPEWATPSVLDSDGVTAVAALGQWQGYGGNGSWEVVGLRQ